MVQLDGQDPLLGMMPMFKSHHCDLNLSALPSDCKSNRNLSIRLLKNTFGFFLLCVFMVFVLSPSSNMGFKGQVS